MPPRRRKRKVQKPYVDQQPGFIHENPVETTEPPQNGASQVQPPAKETFPAKTASTVGTSNKWRWYLCSADCMHFMTQLVRVMNWNYVSWSLAQIMLLFVSIAGMTQMWNIFQTETWVFWILFVIWFSFMTVTTMGQNYHCACRGCMLTTCFIFGFTMLVFVTDMFRTLHDTEQMNTLSLSLRVLYIMLHLIPFCYYTALLLFRCGTGCCRMFLRGLPCCRK